MKTSERHHLKQNVFREKTLALVNAAVEHRDRAILIALLAAIAIVAVGGFAYWRRSAREAGAAMLGGAMAVAQAPIVPAPTLPGATQAAGTYSTLEARNEAALKLFQEVAAEYPGTDAGRAAAYHAASSLLLVGRAAEAEAAFAASVAGAGSSIYGPMSRLGQAEAQVAQGKYDEAIKQLTDLSGDRDGALPVDGVLMQLARASMKAAKTSEAKAAFKRVVDEFPQSPYAAEARRQLTILG
jgi:TolA-binding protein